MRFSKVSKIQDVIVVFR